MIAKLRAAFSLFQKGKAVADPANWKTRAKRVNVLVAFLGACIGAAAVFGHEINIPPEVVQDVALAIAAVYGAAVGVYRTITRKDKGLPSKSQPDSERP